MRKEQKFFNSAYSAPEMAIVKCGLLHVLCDSDDITGGGSDIPFSNYNSSDDNE